MAASLFSFGKISIGSATVDALSEQRVALAQSAASKKAELDQLTQQLDVVRGEHESLVRSIVMAKEATERAEERFLFAKQELDELETLLIHSWGNAGVIGTPNYQRATALRAAVAAFPAARKFFEGVVVKAESELKAFEHRHATSLQ